MKKLYISFILVSIIIAVGCTCFAAQFYDTLGTKYEGPTEILYNLGIIDGTSEHIFSANRAITRAEMSKLVFTIYDMDEFIAKVMLEGRKPFKDVSDGTWYYDYVCAAADMKIINGYADGTFRPNETVTYAEAVTMLIRALGYTDLTAKEGESWEEPYIRKMNEIRLAKNVGYFNNSDKALRGDIAIMIWNMLNCETYMIVRENTSEGFIKENIPGKIIDRYYPEYAIIDDDILEEIFITKGTDDDEGEIEYAISTHKVEYIKVPNPVPLKRIGVKISGIYNIEKKEAIAVNFIYDEKFDEGSLIELKELYDLNARKKNEYIIGKSKNYAYVYFGINDRIDRVTYLGSDENILVREIKFEKSSSEEEISAEKYAVINDEIKIPTSKVLINEDGKVVEWSAVKENGVISKLKNDMYIYYNKLGYGALEEITTQKDGKLCLTISGNLYQCDESVVYKLYGSEIFKKATKKNLEEYIGRDMELIMSYSGEIMQISLGESYENAAENLTFGVVIEYNKLEDETIELELAINNKTKIFTCESSLFNKVLEAGTIVYFEYSGSEIDYVKAFENNLETPNGKINMNVEDKTFSEYTFSEETVIYVIEKEYKLNSDKKIDKYTMRAEADKEILTTIENNPVHILYDQDNVLVAVFIEKDMNKHEYQYAKVLEVYQSGKNSKDDNESTNNSVLKIKVSPFNDVISDYTVKGIINCEPGDLISYKTNENYIMIKERYNANLLGDEKDYIIESFDSNNKRATLMNGEKIDFSRKKFMVDGKEYLFEKYLTVFCKVSNSTGKWRFISANIEEPQKLMLKSGDRIAIDEIEDLIVIYRGYKD